jgi:hypothetical protein
MALPASGQISFSQIAQIVYNNASGMISLNDADVRYLLLNTSGQISISNGYNQPVACTYTYSTAGTYTLVTPAYQTMGVTAKGGGQGGNGGTGSDTCTGWCGQFCFFPFCCNGRGGAAGSSGGDSYFRIEGNTINIIATGGTSSGNGGGSGGVVTSGGGGAGGTAGVAFGCTGSAGSVGYPGGSSANTLTKAVNGPPYSNTISIGVGAGGAGGYNAGGTGGGGSVTVVVS